jgi:hypothetical protein
MSLREDDKPLTAAPILPAGARVPRVLAGLK